MIKIERREVYSGRTTAIVYWKVLRGNKLMIECEKKSDAIRWANVYRGV